MSMLGIATLNEVVNKDGESRANIILDKLREGIISSLHQKEGSEQKDGMDLALCVLDINSKQVEFAGAYNPLLILRNDEIIQVKADRMPIGISRKASDAFTSQTINVQQGDMLYMFSDGYPDQFGGEKGKKLKSVGFKKILMDIHKLPVSEQEQELDKRFKEWKGRYEQIDDVIVVGIRIT